MFSIMLSKIIQKFSQKIINKFYSNFDENNRKKLKNYIKTFIPSFLFTIIFNCVYFYLMFNGKLCFEFNSKTIDDLENMHMRFAFVLKYFSPNLIILVINIQYVAVTRCSPAYDPLSGNERFVLKSQKILQNTLEQSFLSLIAQLTMVTHLEPLQIVWYIPSVNFLFFIGRIFFIFFYPNNRTFGFISTMFSSVIIVYYNFYKFFFI